MKRIFVLLSSLFLRGVIPGQSQAQSTWSLKQCIDYGLQHYGTVKLADFQRQTAEQQARQALGLYLPQVSGSGTFTDNLKLQQSVLPAGLLGPEPTKIAFGQKYQTAVSATASQVIYDKSLILGLKAKKPNAELAELNLRQTKEDIIYNVTSNYYQVFVSKQQVTLLQDNLSRTQQVLDILKLQRDNGVIQQIDYTNTQVTYSNTRSQLSLAENELNLSLNRLKYLMGLKQDQQLLLPDLLPADNIPLNDASRFEVHNLASYQQSETTLSLQRLQLERVRAGYQPTLNASATYGALSFANEFNKAFQAFNAFSSIGLTLRIPLFDGFQRDAQIREQKLAVMSQEVQQQLNAAASHLQFNNARSQLERAQANVQNDQRTVKQAQDVYEVTTHQYKHGTRALTDVINADNSYRQAQSNYINSLINYYQARLDLEQSQGTLETFYNQL